MILFSTSSDTNLYRHAENPSPAHVVSPESDCLIKCTEEAQTCMDGCEAELEDDFDAGMKCLEECLKQQEECMDACPSNKDG
jgi:hypothetical protein